MDDFSFQINELLSDAFRSILKVEEQMIKSSSNIDLSISEIHLIEAVGKNNNIGQTISHIAEDLGITLPSVTVAINKLVKRGYVKKVRCENDARVVRVTLTKFGLRMNAAHKYFHRNMVRSVTKGLTVEEKDAMVKGIKKLNTFLKYELKVLEG